MNIQTPEKQGKVDGPWLQFWNDANAVSLSTARIAFGQLELAALTGRFMTQRLRAYSASEGRAESLAQRLDKITEQFGEDYAKQLREIYSSIGQAGATLKSVPTTDTPSPLPSIDRAPVPAPRARHGAKIPDGPAPSRCQERPSVARASAEPQAKQLDVAVPPLLVAREHFGMLRRLARIVERQCRGAETAGARVFLLTRAPFATQIR